LLLFIEIITICTERETYIADRGS